ncbi:hypothetical protein BT69DRAFT_1232202 [Atractiella rhizophila]|nr:hypothetical protein BT69DRAFT_1232202 [Atractiella rhizophila]
MTEQEKEEEELNRMARDDDKRRRNTAASARFRVRKKEREAALEASAKTLQQKVIELEKEVEALKTENSWLRELIVQKSRAEPSAASKKE